MSKIIIYNNVTALSDHIAVDMVKAVISKGKIFNGSYSLSTLFCHKIINYKITYCHSKGKNAHVFKVCVEKPKLEPQNQIIFDDAIDNYRSIK